MNAGVHFNKCSITEAATLRFTFHNHNDMCCGCFYQLTLIHQFPTWPLLHHRVPVKYTSTGLTITSLSMWSLCLDKARPLKMWTTQVVHTLSNITKLGGVCVCVCVP